MTQIVDQLNAVGSGFDAFGESNTSSEIASFVGQTFKALGPTLQSVEFMIDTSSSGGPTAYRVVIVDVTDPANFAGGTALFTSSVMVDPNDADPTLSIVKVDTNLAVTYGHVYAFVLDAYQDRDSVASTSTVGESRPSFATGFDYLDGHMVDLFNNPLGTFTGVNNYARLDRSQQQ
jgi:hypothetical protein